jgi:ribosome-binding factor A
MYTSRLGRLQRQLQQEIATIIHRELKDPRLGFVTITKVELSSDLSHAKVHYSCLGPATQRTHSQEALDHATGFIRGLVKKRLRLKIIPELVFRYDETIAQAIDLAAKLDQLRSSPKTP